MVSMLPRRCQCDNGDTSPSPPFVGKHYFCGSTRPEDAPGLYRFLPDALLWDGQVCEGTWWHILLVQQSAMVHQEPNLSCHR